MPLLSSSHPSYQKSPARQLVSKRLTIDHNPKTLPRSLGAILGFTSISIVRCQLLIGALISKHRPPLSASKRAGIRVYILYLTEPKEMLTAQAVRFPCQCR